MPKRIIVNKGETIKRVERTKRRLDGRFAWANAEAVVTLTIRLMTQDARFLVPVLRPRRSDPAWVAERLAEGHEVWRCSTTRKDIKRAIREIQQGFDWLLFYRSFFIGPVYLGFATEDEVQEMRQLDRLLARAHRMQPAAFLRRAARYK